MIFLTVGTRDGGFDRLVNAVDQLVADGVITDTVTAQIADGSYRPDNMNVLEFCSPDDFTDLIASAEFVISHAGMGTIIESLKRNKTVLVVPRSSALGEMCDDHQFETARQLEAEGKILVAYDAADLPTRIEEVATFVPNRDEGSNRILQAVESFVEGVAHDIDR